jgi:uncharacterized Ntn-hydrolase superfamily protein
MTFSIVGCDLRTSEWGIAVASKFLAVGAVVPWAQGGVGAIATQSYANTAYGPQGLQLMRDGSSARETLDQLVAGDPGRAQRQVGVVDARGRSATHTGDECMAWAGGRTGRGYAAQGNILAGPGVVDAMADSFESSDGEPLGERLMAALLAGDEAGGDRRGKQSAALTIVSPGRGYAGFNDIALDLRVDDHDEPVQELRRLLEIHTLLFGQTPEDEKLSLTGPLAAEVHDLLTRAGYPPRSGESGLDEALRAWVGSENLEERWYGGEKLDPVVLERLRAAVAGPSG